MTELTFEVLGSQGDIYEIEVGVGGPGNIWMTCTCPAGENGLQCKHRIALLRGDSSRIASSNLADLDTLRRVVIGSDLEQCLATMADCEAEEAAAKAAHRAAKQALARAMHD